MAIYYVIAAVLACLLGSTEIVTRFRGYWQAALWSPPAAAYLSVHAVMAMVALYLVSHLAEVIDPQVMPAWIKTNPLYAAVFSGLFYGLVLRAKFVDVKSPQQGQPPLSFGTLTIFDGLLNWLEIQIDTIHNGKVLQLIGSIIHGKDLRNFGAYVKAAIDGYKTIPDEKKANIKNEADSFTRTLSGDPPVPPSLAVSALARVIIDQIGVRGFRDLVRNSP